MLLRCKISWAEGTCQTDTQPIPRNWLLDPRVLQHPFKAFRFVFFLPKSAQRRQVRLVIPKEKKQKSLHATPNHVNWCSELLKPIPSLIRPGFVVFHFAGWEVDQMTPILSYGPCVYLPFASTFLRFDLFMYRWDSIPVLKREEWLPPMRNKICEQWKNPGYLYIGDYTTQLCGDYNKAI